MFYTHNHVSGILLNKKIIGKGCFNNHKHAEVYHNISNVIYSDDDKLVEEKVCNIQTSHISKKFKF